MKQLEKNMVFQKNYVMVYMPIKILILFIYSKYKIEELSSFNRTIEVQYDSQT